MTTNRKTIWNAEIDAKLENLWKANLPLWKIAMELGLSPASIQTRASRRGLRQRRRADVIKVSSDGKANWTLEEIDELKKMRTRGDSNRMMADRFGRSASAIISQLSKLSREGVPTVTTREMRPCLICKKPFGSEGWTNRQCKPCFLYNTYLE